MDIKIIEGQEKVSKESKLFLVTTPQPAKVQKLSKFGVTSSIDYKKRSIEVLQKEIVELTACLKEIEEQLQD